MLQKIVFFDGVCHLCNSFAESIMLRRKRHSLSLATLQGKTAQEVLPEHLRSQLKTMVYFDGNEFYTESTAVIKILVEFGGPWHLMSLLWVLPRPFRDLVYRLVASLRNTLFGKRESCRVPTPEEAKYFFTLSYWTKLQN